MRYQNWDVLLFPGGSRAPIQEFDTKYHMLPQRSRHLIDELSGSLRLTDNNAPFNVLYEDDLYLNAYESINRVPMLTSFIPSLNAGSTFRVSIHSWEPPKPSRILSNIMVQGETVMYEARVYIDGHLMTEKTFSSDAVWPEIIDFSSAIENKEGRKLLQFPQFHSEILDQAHWDATEAYGRIGVVIAEGVTHDAAKSDNQTLGFDRLRDQIAFSFQHAPRHILEYSNIAWPNARMFRPEPKLSMRSSTLASRLVLASKPDFQAHAHSPHRSQDTKSKTDLTNLKSSLSMKGPQEDCVNPSACFTATKSVSYPCDDPFVCPAPVPHRKDSVQARKSSTDSSMPDYVSDKAVRRQGSTEMSDVNYQKVDFLKHMSEAAVTEIVRALSPERREELISTLSPTEALSIEHNVPQTTISCRSPSGLIQSCQAISNPITLTDVDCGDVLQRYLRSRVLSDAGTTSSRVADKPNYSPPISVPPGAYHASGAIPLNTELPSMPGSWQASHQNSADIWIAKTPSLSDMLRPRSSSSGSKRKRQASPVKRVTAMEPVIAPGMSISPSKQGGSPLELSNGSSADEDVPLSASKWAKNA